MKTSPRALRTAVAVAILAAGMPARADPAEAGAPSPGAGQAATTESAVEVDLQRQLNALRSDLLDERERRMELREGATGLALVVLGIVIGIGGLWFCARFQSIAAEARIGATAARRYELAPRGLLSGAEGAHPVPREEPGLLPPLPSPGRESVADTPAGRGEGTAASPAAAARNGSARAAGAAFDAAELQRREEAIADCTAAIRLDCRDPRLFVERGDARCGAGRYEEALADYDRAIGLDPNLVAAYLGRCCANSELGRHEEAIEDFDRISCLDPDAAAELAQG